MSKNETRNKPIELSAATRIVHLKKSEQYVFNFPDGVPAFEEYQNFMLFSTEDMQPFFQMKSVGEGPELSFVCIDPFLICPDYRVKISKGDLKMLGLERAEDAFVYSLVTLSSDPQNITANLQGPMVLNLKTGLGKQIICEGGEYDVRYRIMDAINGMADRPESSVAVSS